MSLSPSESTPTGRPPSIQADLRGASSSSYRGFTIQRGADGRFEATRPMTGGVGVIRIKSDSEEGVKDIIDNKRAKIDEIEKTSIAAGKSLRATGADFEQISVLGKKTSQPKRQYTSLQRAQVGEHRRKSEKIETYEDMKNMLEKLQKMPSTKDKPIFPNVRGISKLSNYENLQSALRHGLKDDHVKDLAKGFECSENEIKKVFGQQPQSDVNAYITSKLAVLESRIQALESTETQLKQLSAVGTRTLSTNPPTPPSSQPAASVSTISSTTTQTTRRQEPKPVPAGSGPTPFSQPPITPARRHQSPGSTSQPKRSPAPGKRPEATSERTPPLPKYLESVPKELRDSYKGDDRCLFFFDNQKAMEEQIKLDERRENKGMGTGRVRLYLSPAGAAQWNIVKIQDGKKVNQSDRSLGGIIMVEQQLGENRHSAGFGNPDDLIRSRP